MQYLPIHINTRGSRILVVGAGEAAEAKLRTLIKTEANILILAHDVNPEVQRWIEAGTVNQATLIHEARDFTAEDLQGVALVYAATEDDDLNADIAALATAHNIPVNAADQKEACSFITPALVDRAPMVNLAHLH